MEWSKVCMDVIMIPSGVLFPIVYHGWLFYMVRTRPQRTNLGIDAVGQQLWISAMLKDNDKKNILAVQTLRNSIMSSTLMASTCILICCGLLTFTSNIYSHRSYETSTFDSSGAITLAFKSATLVLVFLSVFVSQALSIMFLNQVGILINILTMECCTITEQHVYILLRKGIFLNTVGNRLFFIALPLILWLFGPIPVFVCSLATVPVLYNLDIVPGEKKPVIGVRVANA
ncbi:uncharacterized protein LOC120256659 [Dioscorea cayenensis subsp. rotundata]|uniref:Uncharacterized protein LOC120256659 n=1 Tax=Dioscorea cayennensis subsp. rotundata TaxID=55577 RepID=A0AB40AZB5_DIOCR|nr:uncharacterized protein LOC120256659 [Dioscorea cayenensis subsp. rotundata]